MNEQIPQEINNTILVPAEAYGGRDNDTRREKRLLYLFVRWRIMDVLEIDR